MVKPLKTCGVFGTLLGALLSFGCSKTDPIDLTEYARNFEPVSVKVKAGQSAVIRNSDTVLIVVPEKTEPRTFRQDTFLVVKPFEVENMHLIHSSTNRDTTMFEVAGIEFRVTPVADGVSVRLKSYESLEHLAVYDSTDLSNIRLESLSFKTNSPPSEEDYNELKNRYEIQFDSK